MEQFYKDDDLDFSDDENDQQKQTSVKKSKIGGMFSK